ncbi:MAG TPA: CAP domain-containing protein, partial [Polyangiales bacterium]|nr:CAP domain-containing protein [Polyangiales bacterium]
AGDMTEKDRATAHRLFNLYRFMAGLEPVAMSAAGNQLAQGCALLMGANGKISHTPDSTWKCYSKEAADTAGASSLSGGGSISSVDGYMIDPGNPTTIGHRRWILSNMLSGVGFGSSGKFSCQYQPAQRAPATAKAWAAWPPPGQVPIQALGNRFSKIDQTGWSVQSDRISLNGAQVTVTSGGMDMPVTTTALLPGYGSSFALRFNPTGWTAAAGQTYSVKVTGGAMPIEYEVQVVDCP